MNKLFKYLFLSLTIALTLTLIAQEPAKNTAPPAKDGAKADAKKDDLALLKEYTPIPQLDPSFTVSGTSYLRRAAHNGKGDVLDVQINIANNEASLRDYSIYVFAYN